MKRSGRVVVVGWTLMCVALVGMVEPPSEQIPPPLDPPASEPDGAKRVDHFEFTRMLSKYVDSAGRIDYVRWKMEEGRELRAYLKTLADVDVESLDRDEQLAFYINLYNATVISQVLSRYEPGFRVDEDNYQFFKRPSVRLGKDRISLNHLENEIIREQFDDPRIHVALVCAAVSCPPIQPRAFDASTLEATLDNLMRSFLRDESRNVVDRDARLLKLSSIFDWYAKDFGGRDALVAYADQYIGWDVAGFVITFLPYDWSLNIVPPDPDLPDEETDEG